MRENNNFNTQVMKGKKYISGRNAKFVLLVIKEKLEWQERIRGHFVSHGPLFL